MKVKILHISDTHGEDLGDLPEADILVHTGDYSFLSKSANLKKQVKELNLFNDYLGKVKSKYSEIIFTPGNHDFIFEQDPKLAKEVLSNAIVLINQSCTALELSFYGTPSQPPFFDWAFNDDDIRRSFLYKKIPDATDVLLTHCPPNEILDKVSFRSYSACQNVGCNILRHEVESRIKPKLHCFGHIHENNAVVNIGGIMYSNACLMDDRYVPNGTYNIIEVDNG